MKALVEHLVTSLVESPNEVRIETTESPKEVSFSVTVAEADMGRVIGRGGRVARAIRTVVKAAAVKDGRRVNVEFGR